MRDAGAVARPHIPIWLGQVWLLATALGGLAIFTGCIAADATGRWTLGGPFIAGIDGFLLAVGFVGVSWGLLAWLSFPPAAPTVVDIHRTKSEATIDDILNNLEADRQDAIQRLRGRKWAYMAGGAALGLVWAWVNLDHHLDVFLTGVQMLCGATLGYVFGESQMNRGYQRHYKAKVLPMLAAEVGDLSYRQPDAAALARFRGLKLFHGYIVAEAADEIFGTYRGLATSIMRLRLTRLIKGRDEPNFTGFLARVELRNRLLGTTVVLKSGGVFGALIFDGAEWGLQPVHLEDPVFSREYRVYASDQVMARALLTPAFMEAFRTVGGLALAQDRELTLALPREEAAHLFRAPTYQDPAGSRGILSALLQDIRAMLGVVDAVIDLDEATRREAAPAPEALQDES